MKGLPPNLTELHQNGTRGAGPGKFWEFAARLVSVAARVGPISRLQPDFQGILGDSSAPY